ncbi:MAG: hypothetical protein CMJ69_18755 [Planctomycetaceae bacterium]|nr:hypothetical protein [Planctomycetaceae bacterium]
MGQVVSGVVDQVLEPQFLSLPRVTEYLAHRKWNRGLLTDQAERVEVLGAKQVLEIEQVERSQVTCQAKSL